MKTDELMLKAKAKVADCERAVQEIVKEAVAEGEYEAVMRLAALAKALGELATAPSGVAPSSPLSSAPARQAKAGPPRRTAMPAKKGPAADYPRFLRRGNDLVKVGWSKREKQEYQHKAPESAVRVVTDAIAQAGQDGQLVRMDQLFPMKQEAAGVEVPTYQAYVCLAWLRAEGFVVQDGRQGYTVPKPDALTKAVDAAWNRLSQNHARGPR